MEQRDWPCWEKEGIPSAWLSLNWDMHFSCLQTWNISTSWVSSLLAVGLEPHHWLFWVSSFSLGTSQSPQPCDPISYNKSPLSLLSLPLFLPQKRIFPFKMQSIETICPVPCGFGVHVISCINIKDWLQERDKSQWWGIDEQGSWRLIRVLPLGSMAAPVNALMVTLVPADQPGSSAFPRQGAGGGVGERKPGGRVSRRTESAWNAKAKERKTLTSFSHTCLKLSISF